MENKNSFRSSLLPFFTAVLLIALYLLMTVRRQWFQLTDFVYQKDPEMVFNMMPSIHVTSTMWKLLLLLPATLLLAWTMTRLGFIARLHRFAQSDKFALFLAILSLFIFAGIVLFVYHGTEFTDDELTFTFQAKTFLDGRLINPPPPASRNFANIFIINDGVKYVGHYQFGHPLLLAVGLMFGSEYIVTFLMAAALIILLAAIARRLFEDRRVAIIAPLLLFVSPFFYFVSSSRLSHISSAFLLALFFLIFLEVMRAEAKPGKQYLLSLLAGLAAGLAGNIRPMTALAFLLPFLYIIIRRLVKKEIQHPLIVIFMGSGVLAVILLTFAYDKVITGSYFMQPIIYLDPTNAMGFGWHQHTIGKAIQNLLYNGARMNAFLFGFPLSLVFVFFVFFKDRLEQGERIAFAIIVCFSIGYLFWWSPGVGDLGPIYYYECIIPLILLSARGFLWVHDFVSARFQSFSSFVPNFLLFSVVMSLLTFVPEKAIHFSNLTQAIDAPYALLRERNVHNAVVFTLSLRQEGWVYGYRNNDPTFDNDIIVCRSLDPASNSHVIESFKGRELYVLLWYGTPLRYELRKLSREELLSTNWSEELQRLRALPQIRTNM
jgi:hypothetical protein